MIRADSAHQPQSCAGSGFHPIFIILWRPVYSFLQLTLTLSFSPPFFGPVLSAEFLLSDEFRFYTGVTAILVDTCLRHIPGSCASVRAPFLSSVPVLSAGKNNNNNLATGQLGTDLRMYSCFDSRTLRV